MLDQSSFIYLDALSVALNRQKFNVLNTQTRVSINREIRKESHSFELDMFPKPRPLQTSQHIAIRENENKVQSQCVKRK